MGITNKQRGTQVLSGLGAWQDIPYNPANFQGNGGMTWTVPAPYQNRFSRVGNTVTWSVLIASSTIGGTPGLQLVMTAPTKAKSYACATGRCSNNGGVQTPLFVTVSPVSPAPGYVAIGMAQNVNFAVGTLQLYFTLTYEVEP
jgi:hypothetical protein